MMPREKKTLFEALTRAGRLILAHHRRPRQVRFKGGSPINLVTETDQACDRLIRGIIRRAFPDHNLLTEESDPTQSPSPLKWIVDPLDGTTNFAHGYPQCAVSIALEQEGTIVLGGVYDPFRDELFWAQKGGGAWLVTGMRDKAKGARGKRIKVSSNRTLATSLLLTGFPYDRRENADLYLSYVKAFMHRIQGIRREGAAALDLCWVACGRVDGYWEWRLKPWDLAAGSLIVNEAGGRLSGFSGEPHSIYREQTLATNGLVHEEMLAVMRELDRKGQRPKRRPGRRGAPRWRRWSRAPRR